MGLLTRVKNKLEQKNREIKEEKRYKKEQLKDLKQKEREAYYNSYKKARIKRAGERGRLEGKENKKGGFAEFTKVFNSAGDILGVETKSKNKKKEDPFSSFGGY